MPRRRGLIPIADRNRESFQEFDPHAWFGTQCKRVLVLDQPERASEIVAEAFFAAQEGRPGPVVVGLPEDVIKLPFEGELHPVIPVAEGGVSAADLDQKIDHKILMNISTIFEPATEVLMHHYFAFTKKRMPGSTETMKYFTGII